MGGMGNIMNMVKEMSKMDGIGDLMKGMGGGNMADMMKNLGGNLPGLGGLKKKRWSFLLNKYFELITFL